MILPILSAIMFFLILRWDVNSDYEKWKKEIPINHTKELILRSVYLLPSFICLFLPIGDLNMWGIIAKLVISLGIISSVWWELFDGWYNLKRGFSWRFNGSDDEDDAVTDNILQKMSPLSQAFLKLGLIALFVYLYFIIFI